MRPPDGQSAGASGRLGRAGWPALLLLAVLAGGCVQFEMTFGRPVPGEAELARLVPGETTRAEVLALFGPPEEYLLPLPTGRWRAVDPAAQRILEERELLGRRVFSFLFERRRDDLLLLVPFVMIFHSWWTEHESDRVLVFFDEQGRVEHVAVRRELGA